MNSKTLSISKSIERYIYSNSNDFNLHEVAFLALAKKVSSNDIKIFKLFKSNILNNKKTSININKMDQLSLIKYCLENNFYPVIIHTHIGNIHKLDFSYEDRLFEQGFIKACNILGYNKILISIIYCKTGYTARICSSYKYKYLEIAHTQKLKCFNINNNLIFIENLLYKLKFFILGG